jgi:hypothetical protein
MWKRRRGDGCKDSDKSDAKWGPVDFKQLLEDVMGDLLSELKEFSDFLKFVPFDQLNCARLRDAIDKLIADYGWHPVSEPPEKDGEYFVTVKETDRHESFVTIDVYNPLKFIGDHWQLDDVVSWMPLPKPYRAKS